MQAIDLGCKTKIELALLRFAPEPPPYEGACKRMVVVILEEGLLDKWPEEDLEIW